MYQASNHGSSLQRVHLPMREIFISIIGAIIISEALAP